MSLQWGALDVTIYTSLLLVWYDHVDFSRLCLGVAFWMPGFSNLGKASIGEECQFYVFSLFCEWYIHHQLYLSVFSPDTLCFTLIRWKAFKLLLRWRLVPWPASGWELNYFLNGLQTDIPDLIPCLILPSRCFHLISLLKLLWFLKVRNSLKQNLYPLSETAVMEIGVVGCWQKTLGIHLR